MLLNRKGETGNQMISLYYIFLMIVIAVGLTAGIVLFFGGEYQFKQIDADEMYLKIANCLRDNSPEEVFKSFYSVCGINENVSKEYFRIKICSGSDSCMNEEEKSRVMFVLGSDFQSCELAGAKGNTNFPRCAKGMVDSNGVRYEIIAGSRQILRRVA